jgi:protein SCO1/2
MSHPPRSLRFALIVLAVTIGCSAAGSDEVDGDDSAEIPEPGTTILDVGEAVPEFALTDQYGDPFTFASLRGKVVLLDFVHSQRTAPCSVLTGVHVEAMNALEPDVLDGVWFVSITVDPKRDSPAKLREYARERGADLSHWSFLSGEPEDVREVLHRYGVTAEPDPALDEIEHLVVTFLIDADGRVAKRYFGPTAAVGEIAGRITQVFRSGG